jgi:hypothetical protein
MLVDVYVDDDTTTEEGVDEWIEDDTTVEEEMADDWAKDTLLVLLDAGQGLPSNRLAIYPMVLSSGSS